MCGVTPTLSALSVEKACDGVFLLQYYYIKVSASRLFGARNGVPIPRPLRRTCGATMLLMEMSIEAGSLICLKVLAWRTVHSIEIQKSILCASPKPVVHAGKHMR